MAKRREQEPSAQRRACASCGTAAAVGDLFCRRCGTRLAASAETKSVPRRFSGLLAFAFAVFALVAVYAFLQYHPGDSGNAAAPFQQLPAGEDMMENPGAAPSTARRAADQLFNQAMSAYEKGDSTTASQFIPMAIAAYEKLDSLDLDARYHLAVLSLAAERPETALEHAETMLKLVPGHLLGLTAAARAQDRLGRPQLALDAYQRFIDVYATEIAALRPEYSEHGRALPAGLDEARRYLRGHGRTPE